MKKSILILISVLFVNIQGAHWNAQAEAIAKHNMENNQNKTTLDNALGKFLMKDLQNLILDYAVSDYKCQEILSIETLEENDPWVHNWWPGLSSIQELRDIEEYGRYYSRMVSCHSAYDTIRIWNYIGGRHNELKGSILIQLKDGTLASGSSDGSIRIWPETIGFFQLNWQLKDVLKGDENCAVTSLIQLKDGRLASCSAGKIRIWQEKENKWHQTDIIKEYGYVYSIIQLKDGRLAVKTSLGKVQILQEDNNKWHQVGALIDGKPMLQLKNGRLVLATADNKIRIFQEEKNIWNEIQVLDGHTNPICSIIEKNDGTLFSCSQDSIRIWNNEAHYLLQQYEEKSYCTIG